MIDYFFEFVKSNKIKIRIMFRQNALVPQNLTREHEEKGYFLLYYQFIKHAFGIDYCNLNEKDQVALKLYFDKLPDTKKKNKVFKGYIYALNDFFCINNVHIYNEDIAEVDSRNHVILQCMDIILGSMNFKLNNMDKEKMPGSNRRGKRTIAKEKLYKNILRNIKTIYPNFNIGVSTSSRGDLLTIGKTLIDIGVLNLKIVYLIHHYLKIQNKKLHSSYIKLSRTKRKASD